MMLISKENWHKILVSGAALVMFMSAGGPALSTVASAKRRPHLTRNIKSKKKYTKADKDIEKSYGPKWKKSWNKYLDAENRPFWIIRSIFSTRLLNKRQRVIGSANYSKQFKADWAQFAKSHKNNFKNGYVPYPVYDQLSDLNNNMHQQKKGRTYLLFMPVLYFPKNTKAEDMRNSEILANAPLHKFSPYWRKRFKAVGIRAHNNQRVLTSFKHWMHKTHQHPHMKIGKYNYVYKSHNFVSTYHNHKHGATYKFNTKTGKRQHISNQSAQHQLLSTQKQIQYLNTHIPAKATKAVQNILPITKANTQKASQQSNNTQPTVHSNGDGSTLVILGGNNQDLLNDIGNNSNIDSSTKNTVKNLLNNQIMPQSQQANPIVALAELASNDQFSKSDRNKAAYMANTLADQVQSQANDKKNALASIANSLQTFYSNQPATTAKQATNYGSDHASTDNTQGLVTNNPNITQDAGVLKDEVIDLAQELGVVIPKGTTITF